MVSYTYMSDTNIHWWVLLFLAYALVKRGWVIILNCTAGMEFWYFLKAYCIPAPYIVNGEDNQCENVHSHMLYCDVFKDQAEVTFLQL